MDGSTLSRQLKAFLRAERDRLPHARILFVRRVERRGEQRLAAFVARTGEAEGGLRRLDLADHDELIGVDLATAGETVEHPLFLVCTHGKHDRCCARYGRPLYDAVCEQVEPGWAWQCSHIGGDRFAGNLVSLPDGVYYGRVAPGDAWAVVEAAGEHRIHLPLYRGRSCHGFAAQAAERAVRELTGLLGVSDVAVVSIGEAGSVWQARIRAGSTTYDVAVRQEEGAPTHLTCAARELRRPKRYVAESPRARAS